ncbi:hypothetical protein HBH47_072950 [Parastagonospora nodorum]|nr:hypothetical protein HBH47_072950 [Parastagonospora nodorum]
MQSATLLTLPLRSTPLKHRRTHCVLCNECIRTADAGRIVRGLENSASASLLVHSDYALQECSPPTAYALNYLELRVLKLTRAFYNNGKWGISAMAGNQDKFQFLSANMMALMGTVLYNAIKEYHDDGTRKTIHFHGYTVENDHHDNNVNDILIKCTDDERQRYNTLIEDYNRAGKREDNILTVDECRTGHSNEEDIEADEREEETRVRLRESSGEIHDILLREFRGANDFTESVTYNDDEQSIVTDSTWDEFAMLAEEYTIDNRIVHALALTKDEWELEPEDCDALVERYEEEINCSDLYSTV